MGLVDGIALGALKVGKKIFEGVKERKSAKIEKRANALLEAQQNKDAAINRFSEILGVQGKSTAVTSAGSGPQVISGSGNALAGIKGAFSPNPNIAAFQPISGAKAVVMQNEAAAAAQSGGGMNPLLLLAGAVLLFFAIKK